MKTTTLVPCVTGFPRTRFSGALLTRAGALLLVLLAWAANAAAQPVVSDDFNQCGLDGSTWAVADPLGDGTVTVVGSGSGDAHLLLSVPGGLAHQPFGANQALRVLQNVGNTDLDLIAKFDSPVTTAFQLQGILIEQDASNYLRFDVYNAGGGSKIFAGTFTNGQVTVRKNSNISTFFPIILRVTRTGDSWNLRYSFDQVTWFNVVTFTHVMTVNQVGPFAGNSPSGGVTPPFTAMVDFFFDVANPITPEDGATFGAPTTLTRNVVGQGSIAADPDQSEYYCDESVTLTAVSDAGWVFDSWTGDVTGTQNPIQVSLADDAVVTATFVQDGTLLQITNLQVAPSVDSATITWDTNDPANSEVAFGLTPSLEAGAVSDPTFVTAHSITLTGLQPNTLYSFEVYSEEPSGNSAVVSGQTFMTTLAPTSGIVSDDFNSCDLDGNLWTVINPLGDATFEVVGVGGDDARIQISVPGGVAHDVWTSGNMAPRIMQAANDTDFEVEVKYDSPLGGKFTMQGLLIEQDAMNFLRFDYYSNGPETKIFAASFTNGAVSVKQNATLALTAPFYMAIGRQGDVFTQYFSTDGSNWTVSTSFTRDMVVNAVGVFVGNGGTGTSPPAFTGQIDYFFNSDDPVLPEDGPLANPATLTTIVGAHGTVAVDPSQPQYFCSESVTVTAVPDPGYVLAQWGGDLTGANPIESLTMNVDRTIEATFVEDPTPLTIFGVQAQPGFATAEILWSTSKAATSSVAYGLTNSYELGVVSSSDLSLAHSLVIPGLAQETTYHYQVTSVGALGESVSSPDMTFTTTLPGGFVSDDFNSFNLNPIWTFVNPVGDATLNLVGTNTPNARLQLSLPAGSDHDVWRTGNRSARVMQAAADVDLSAEVKFESLVTARYQMQGMLIEQDSQNYLRFDVYNNGSSNFIFASSFTPGGVVVRANLSVPAGFPWYLRVTRVGDQWTQQYSFNGLNWNDVVTFNHPMTVTQIGPFAANSGSNPPAFTALVDYFYNTEAPIVPEDGSVVEDTFPPNLGPINVSAGEDTIVLTWVSDEPATTRVRYGLTPAYELGELVSPDYLIDHVAIISGLEPETEYLIEIESEDSNENVGTVTLMASTGAVGSSAGPTIVAWYGDTQEFFAVGTPQPWANILGNVTDAEGVASLRYSLNGGPSIPLNIGPDNRRLFGPGDFNIDLNVANMQPGANQVIITAIDGIGNETSKSLTIHNSAGPVWPLPTTVSWSGLDSVTQVAQVVDGKWGLEPEGLRITELGYDRLVAIGDTSWTDYEATVSFVVHSVDHESAYTPQSGGPAFGMILRWPGHTVGSNQQPYHEFFPLGAIGWFRYKQDGTGRFQLYGNNGGNLDIEPNHLFPFEVEHYLKMRVETVGNTDYYKLKVWPATETEPSEWFLAGSQGGPSDPANGCMLLLAHHVDVTYGDVVVTPGPFADPVPLLISNSQYSAGDSFAVITWETNYLATHTLEYGLTNGYELGTVTSNTPATSHTVTLTGLDPETTYFYRVTVEGGNQTRSRDQSLTTAEIGGMTSSQSSSIVSDDFNSTDLDPIWTFVDPVGDSSYVLDGVDSGSAVLELTVPSGTPHDVWTNGNDAARVVQTIQDTNFDLEVKFESVVTVRYQMQGIVVEQDAGNFIRFDTVKNSSSVRLFAATFVNGSPNVELNITIAPEPEIYFRLSRVGDTWTFSTSNDGQDYQTAVSFNHPMVVSTVGPFVGNAGGSNAPGFTARVDYFFNALEPIDPEDQ
ncbi:MAG: DUF1349 domain-containing protein [Planctomycetota bacterium]